MSLLWLETIATAFTVAVAAASYLVLARLYAEPSVESRDEKVATTKQSA